MTPNSHLFPGITYADMAAEATRELAYRRKTYPDRVGSGRMTEAEAHYQLDMMDAVRRDVERMAKANSGAAAHTFTWAERRKALRRELDFRARFYPQWIDSGRMKQDAADRQTQALAAILWRYDAGFDWIPDNADRRMAEARTIWTYPTGHFWQVYGEQVTMPAQAAML